ncbi:hypothetical protein DPMN_008024 [Dreissena polymorpha]|uniref:Uncharacterized protein n=1 Tax=Dreissena polymorpha TaxID=45954 RepID=A0A9D4RYW0_DREPO|nr:hypothetical protein DPMN_008024 [Dreissena polymorpha]
MNLAVNIAWALATSLVHWINNTDIGLSACCCAFVHDIPLSIMVALGEALAITIVQCTNTTPELSTLAACRLGAICIIVELGEAIAVTIVRCADPPPNLSTLAACRLGVLRNPT